MQWQTTVSRGVDRRRRGAVINECEPTCIAVGKYVDGLVAFRSRDLLNQCQTVLADHPAMLRIFICNQIGCA
jgi:hypothetical protein